jgi:hypothetical protein
MDRRVIKTLIVNDDDLNCDCSSKTIDDISIANVGFSVSIIDSFDMIIYDGTKGAKIIKSTYTKTGIIK